MTEIYRNGTVGKRSFPQVKQLNRNRYRILNSESHVVRLFPPALREPARLPLPARRPPTPRPCLPPPRPRPLGEARSGSPDIGESYLSCLVLELNPGRSNLGAMSGMRAVRVVTATPSGAHTRNCTEERQRAHVRE